MKEWLEGEELSEELKKESHFLKQEVSSCVRSVGLFVFRRRFRRSVVTVCVATVKFVSIFINFLLSLCNFFIKIYRYIKRIALKTAH